MAEKLQVDTSVIITAAEKTHSIKTSLQNAKSDATALEGMVPVSDLRRTLVEFASNWELTREKLIEEIEQLKKQLETVAKAFETVDEEMATALNEKQSESAI